MRKRILALAVAVTFVPAVTADAAVPRHHCKGTFTTRSSTGTGTWTNIKERGTTCVVARRITRAWLRAAHRHPRGYLDKFTVVRGWLCLSLVTQSGSNLTAGVGCSRDAGRQNISFRGTGHT